MFDFRLLDMVELGLEKLVTMHEFKGETNMDGNKPCLLFHGHRWEVPGNFSKLKSLFVDIFRGAVVDNVNLGMCVRACVCVRACMCACVSEGNRVSWPPLPCLLTPSTSNSGSRSRHQLHDWRGRRHNLYPPLQDQPEEVWHPAASC
jgi:hypothetical protein